MLNEIANSVYQLLAFTFIPFLVYLIWFRKKTKFFEFIGLKKAPTKALLAAVVTSLVFLVPPIVLTLVNDSFRSMLLDPTTMTGKFAALGLSTETLVVLGATALVKTSLAEEILFRGFVAKRLMAWLGYQWGNILQAVIFGSIHLLAFIKIEPTFLTLSFILVVPSLGAYISAYLNEKWADGSILPGYVSHALANLLSYSIIGLVIA